MQPKSADMIARTALALAACVLGVLLGRWSLASTDALGRATFPAASHPADDPADLPEAEPDPPSAAPVDAYGTAAEAAITIPPWSRADDKPRSVYVCCWSTGRFLGAGPKFQTTAQRFAAALPVDLRDRWLSDLRRQILDRTYNETNTAIRSHCGAGLNIADPARVHQVWTAIGNLATDDDLRHLARVEWMLNAIRDPATDASSRYVRFHVWD